jgi:hypothetical protein
LDFTGTDFNVEHKPFDVSEPTLLEMPKSQDVCAAMFSASMVRHPVIQHVSRHISKLKYVREVDLFEYQVDESEDNNTEQNISNGE